MICTLQYTSLLPGDFPSVLTPAVIQDTVFHGSISRKGSGTLHRGRSVELEQSELGQAHVRVSIPRALLKRILRVVK